MKFDKEFERTLKHGREFVRALNNNHYEITDTGAVLMLKQGTLIQGVHEHLAPDGLGLMRDHNLIVTEGLNHLWTSAILGGSQITSWYVAIHSGTTAPSASWTAANYASNATEINSSISESARQAYTGATAASGSTNNTSSKAVFTANTTNVTVWGAAVLSTSTKGGTSGTLLSASKFSASRTLPASSDTISIGITLTATSS